MIDIITSITAAFMLVRVACVLNRMKLTRIPALATSYLLLGLSSFAISMDPFFPHEIDEAVWSQLAVFAVAGILMFDRRLRSRINLASKPGGPT